MTSDNRLFVHRQNGNPPSQSYYHSNGCHSKCSNTNFHIEEEIGIFDANSNKCSIRIRNVVLQASGSCSVTKSLHLMFIFTYVCKNTYIWKNIYRCACDIFLFRYNMELHVHQLWIVTSSLAFRILKNTSLLGVQ